MRRVQQLDDDGCGLACVAMVTGKTYPSIRRDYPDGVDGTHLRHLRRLLRKHRAGCGDRMIPLRTRQPSDLPFDAIIKINPRQDGKEWHWVIWDHRRRRILDPKNPPYKRLRYVSYVRVRQPARRG